MSAVEILPGQGNNKPTRYFLSTRLTYQMLVNNIRRNITETERDQVIAEFVQRLANTGPFTLHFVAADAGRTPTKVLKNAGLDNAYSNRLIVLDPAQFTLRNGTEEATLAAISLAMGLDKGVDQLPVQWASSAVYAVINAQRRALARKVATEYIAREKALAAPEVQNDAELKGRGTKDLAQAKEQLQKAIRRAYQHVVYLAQPDPDGERRLSEVTFDDDHSSALDGTIVWKALAEREKVFDADQFGAKALVHNLRDGDYGKTLSDIRRAFYSAPRMPLLHGGDGDLQQAIYDAVVEGLLDVVDGSGTTVAVTAPNQINLASTGLRFVRPQAKTCPHCGRPAHPGECERNQPGGSSTSGDGTSGETGTTGGDGSFVAGQGGAQTQSQEKHLAFTVTRNTLVNPEDADQLAAVFRRLYVALDDRNVNYLQANLQLLTDAATAEAVRELLAELQIKATVQDAKTT